MVSPYQGSLCPEEEVGEPHDVFGEVGKRESVLHERHADRNHCSRQQRSKGMITRFFKAASLPC